MSISAALLHIMQAAVKGIAELPNPAFCSFKVTNDITTSLVTLDETLYA